VILDGGEGHDVLRAARGNDLLLGGKGNDELSGGAGQDIYVHGLCGGNDEIDEAGITGETDVLRFGEGITRDMIHARRHRDDLVLDVAGPHGSVTVKDWFASEAQRIELIEFADGTAWDEGIVRRLVHHRHDDDWHDEKHWADDRHDERRNRAPQERADRRDERAEGRDEGATAIPERLWQKSCFDFETLARELDRSSKHDEALSPQEIARRWAAVHRYTSALALEADEHADHSALTGWQSFAVLGLLSASGFGFEASIGAARGPESLKSLEGLNEGFRRL
jgi:Ca2+-binding RTX toxin-like protein